jgi:hypothetical protein
VIGTNDAATTVTSTPDRDVGDWYRVISAAATMTSRKKAATRSG